MPSNLYPIDIKNVKSSLQIPKWHKKKDNTGSAPVKSFRGVEQYNWPPKWLLLVGVYTMAKTSSLKILSMDEKIDIATNMATFVFAT